MEVDISLWEIWGDVGRVGEIVTHLEDGDARVGVG